MKKDKWKPWELPSEDGLLGLLLESGGEMIYFMYNHNLDEEDGLTKTLIATSLYPIYIAKACLERASSYLNKKVIK
jgi:hypothetical protein